MSKNKQEYAAASRSMKKSLEETHAEEINYHQSKWHKEHWNARIAGKDHDGMSLPIISKSAHPHITVNRTLAAKQESALVLCLDNIIFIMQ